jgi:hypothetical protein
MFASSSLFMRFTYLYTDTHNGYVVQKRCFLHNAEKFCFFLLVLLTDMGEQSYLLCVMFI